MSKNNLWAYSFNLAIWLLEHDKLPDLFDVLGLEAVQHSEEGRYTITPCPTCRKQYCLVRYKNTGDKGLPVFWACYGNKCHEYPSTTSMLSFVQIVRDCSVAEAMDCLKAQLGVPSDKVLIQLYKGRQQQKKAKAIPNQEDLQRQFDGLVLGIEKLLAKFGPDSAA